VDKAPVTRSTQAKIFGAAKRTTGNLVTVNVAISLFPADATADSDHITF
jgi:hypothetical protein